MTNTINVGIGGLGAIGMPVARWLDVGVAGLGLAGVHHEGDRQKSDVADDAHDESDDHSSTGTRSSSHCFGSPRLGSRR